MQETFDKSRKRALFEDDRVWSCPRSAAAHSPSCDLDNVYGGCHINAYRNLADGFVMTNDTSDGDVIVATNAKVSHTRISVHDSSGLIT